LELGQTDTLSLVGVVVALHLVPKSTELFGVNVGVELDNQGALSVSIAPKFTGGTVFLACWRAEHGTQLRADIIAGRPVTCKQVDYDARNSRPVAQCFAGEDDLQAMMVSAGWAWSLRLRKSILTKLVNSVAQ
jgi:hypothetical protein